MVTYVVGIAFLVVCLFGVPLVRKLALMRSLRHLEMEGVSVVSRGWESSGLKITRARWTGDVTLTEAGLSAGRPGHLRLAAKFNAKIPDLSFFPPGEEDLPELRTGDEDFDRTIGVIGDAAFARKLLVPEMRELLIRLDSIGGRLREIGNGELIIDGPRPRDREGLRKFLELCDAVIERTATAAGG